MVWRQSLRSGGGRETLPEARKWSLTLPEAWKWSGDPPGGPEVVGRQSRTSGSGQETLQEVR